MKNKNEWQRLIARPPPSTAPYRYTAISPAEVWITKRRASFPSANLRFMAPNCLSLLTRYVIASLEESNMSGTPSTIRLNVGTFPLTILILYSISYSVKINFAEPCDATVRRHISTAHVQNACGNVICNRTLFARHAHPLASKGTSCRYRRLDYSE